MYKTHPLIRVVTVCFLLVGILVGIATLGFNPLGLPTFTLEQSTWGTIIGFASLIVAHLDMMAMEDWP